MEWLYAVGGFLIGTIIVPLIQGVAGNLLTDVLKNWFARRSAASAQKRITELQKELVEITKLYKSREERYLEFFSDLFIHALIASFAAGITLYAFVFGDNPIRRFLLYVTAGMFFVLVGAFFGSARKVARIQRYDEYKQRTEQRIAELSKKIPAPNP